MGTAHFTRRVALAVTALGGSNAGKDMVMAQQKATNQRAYFQAKAVRWRPGSDSIFNTQLGDSRCRS